jgi:hypothetical protein
MQTNCTPSLGVCMIFVHLQGWWWHGLSILKSASRVSRKILFRFRWQGSRLSNGQSREDSSLRSEHAGEKILALLLTVEYLRCTTVKATTILDGRDCLFWRIIMRGGWRDGPGLYWLDWNRNCQSATCADIPNEGLKAKTDTSMPAENNNVGVCMCARALHAVSRDSRGIRNSPPRRLVGEELLLLQPVLSLLLLIIVTS